MILSVFHASNWVSTTAFKSPLNCNPLIFKQRPRTFFLKNHPDFFIKIDLCESNPFQGNIKETRSWPTGGLKFSCLAIFCHTLLLFLYLWRHFGIYSTPTGSTSSCWSVQFNWQLCANLRELMNLRWITCNAIRARTDAQMLQIDSYVLRLMQDQA